MSEQQWREEHQPPDKFCVGKPGRSLCETCQGRIPAGEVPTARIAAHIPWPFDPCPHYVPEDAR